MLMSRRDIDALRMVCWCQCVDANDMLRVFTKTELDNLRYLRLIKRYVRNGAYTATAVGLSFLRRALSDELPDLTLSYHSQAMLRRMRVSQIVLTAYQAGINPFITKTEELTKEPSMFLSAISRSRGSNPWGSTRVAALAHFGGQVFAFHYVCPEIGPLSLSDELMTFSNQSAHLHGQQRGIVFAGASYGDVLAELQNLSDGGYSRLIGYGDAYSILQLPVYILSCDAVGAVQLRLMSLPDYRRRLTLAALRDQFSPPPEELPECDALFQGVPFLMAADMDLRRIDAALNKARSFGTEKPVLAALEGQAEAVLYERYRDTGKARVFALTEEALAAALGTGGLIYEPKSGPYLTRKGETIDAPPIKAG